jgi:distribution and morphology protein 12
MSIEIDWNTLLEDEDVLSDKVRSFLDGHFQNLTLPPYIESVSVTSFKLGTVAPEVTIKRISDPFPEFYADEFEGEGITPTFAAPSPPEEPSLPPQPDENEELPDSSRRPSFLENEQQDEEEDGQAQFSYFQPSLSSGFLNMRSPLYAPFQGVGSPRPLSRSQFMADNPRFRRGRLNLQEQHEDSRQNDIQLFLEIAYNGDLQLGITATLLLNYPSPSFVSLPIKVMITGLEVRALAVLAYVSNRIHFSFICDIDGEGDDAVTLLRQEKIDIIRNIKIESEIGAQHANGPVLRNVGKVERFLLERIRTMARDELAWPGWITFEF